METYQDSRVAHLAYLVEATADPELITKLSFLGA